MDLAPDPAVDRFKAKLEPIFAQVENGGRFVTLLTNAYAKYKEEKTGSTNTCLLLSNHIKLDAIFLDPQVSKKKSANTCAFGADRTSQTLFSSCHVDN